MKSPREVRDIVYKEHFLIFIIVEVRGIGLHSGLFHFSHGSCRGLDRVTNDADKERINFHVPDDLASRDDINLTSASMLPPQ